MPDDKISVTFEQDHDRLDGLFESFQQQKRTDFAGAKRAFMEFKTGLLRHIRWEEDLLFPKWEENSGMAEGGPTQIMRSEHRSIRDGMDAIQRGIDHEGLDSGGDEQRLLELLKAHNMKEERILYPSMDQVIDEEERAAIYRAMKEMPEAPHQAGGARDQP